MDPETMARAARGVVRLSRQVEITLAEFQLSVSQFRVLDRLSGGRAAGRSLAEWLAVKPPSITALVDGLVARALVARGADPSDRRRVTHELTDEGRRIHTEVTAALSTRLSELARHVGDTARGDEIVHALAAWNDVLERAHAAKAAAVVEADSA